jgi:ABC-type lipoprotein export system ATPase subunit
VIALDKVTKTYGKKAAPVAAVRELSLTVERGEFVVLTGRSGSGKTTLLNLVAGLARPTAGRVTLEGIDLWQLPDGEQSLFRNRKIGFVFQFPSLMPALSSLENVMLPRLFGPRDRRAGARERATHLLEEVGLGDKLHALPRELSGGQQQRVVVARALVNEPELLLAIPILVLGILSVVSRQRETRMVLGLLGLVLGVLVILPPTVLIGVCPGSMDCNAVMKPSMILMGGLVAAVNLASGIFSGLGRGKTRSRSE